MNDIVAAFLFMLGSLFFVLATVGILKLPDLYTRTSASTKGATLGLTCILFAVAVHFGELSTTTQVILTVLFVLITAPVSSHMIGRASYFVGIPLWEGTRFDEIKGHYHADTHELDSDDAPPQPVDETPHTPQKP